jgi:hypothetical protein
MSRGEARRRDEGGGRYAFHLAEQMTPTALAVFPELAPAQSAAGAAAGAVPAGTAPEGGPGGTVLEGAVLEDAVLGETVLGGTVLEDTVLEGGTVLEGTVRNRVELYLVLDRFALLGVTLLEVQRLPD